jgi:flagellar assembly factor FliW
MVGGLIGFPDATRFLLLESAEVAPLRCLVSLTEPELELTVIDPRHLIAEYRIRLTPKELSRLELEPGDEEGLLPLAIAVLGSEPEDSTANLKAPVIVNTRRMIAAQVVLVEDDYSICHPLLPRSPD